MTELEIDGEIIPIANIDLLLLKDVDGEPGIYLHYYGGGMSSCKFQSKDAQEEGREKLRMGLAGLGFHEYRDLFFRPEAIIASAVGKNKKDGPYLQIGFRGGMLIRHTFQNTKIRDEEFDAFKRTMESAGVHAHKLH